MTGERARRRAEVVQQIRLDQLAADACELLSSAGIEHAVIKGVTTARWLYDPPRPYRDVDLLVPFSSLSGAIAALEPIAAATTGGFGEEAPHSQVLIDHRHGAELDLHATVPASWIDPRDPDEVWRVLGPHLEVSEVDGRRLTVLDAPGRCLVLAMHVVASGHDSDQVREDLRRAHAAASEAEWAEALRRAGQLRLGPAFLAALDFSEGRSIDSAPAEIRLRLEGGSAAAIQLTRLRSMRRLDAVRVLAREVWPSRSFMHRFDASSSRSRSAMFRSRIRRINHLVLDSLSWLMHSRRA